ncbi:MAG: type IV toxin-antitoxin system AbiEi family antitoxin [Coriobacteriia bacterium]|nr:type IV toxin-antitoxin system AbiEi family antitoxin [Coriobacteriia bacterium]
MKEQEVLDGLPDALRACFEGVPNATITSIERQTILGDARIDLLVRIRLFDRTRTLVIEAKASGQPRIARAAVAQLQQELAGGRLDDAYAVFAAPYVSEAARIICREADCGYFDLAGNCLFSFDGVYIERASGSRSPAEDRGEPSLFSPKSSRIVRLLLNEPRREWQVQQLSQVGRVSIGLASRIKRQLEQREWLVTGESGVRATQPEAMLEAWAAAYDYKQNGVAQYFSLDNLSEAEASVAEWCRESSVTYALTGFSGARLLAPRVRYNRATIYVSSRMESAAAGAGLKPVDSGANVVLLRPFDEGVYDGSTDRYGLRAVSPVQMYLDLCSMPGRGAEAAQEILERELRPSW